MKLTNWVRASILRLKPYSSARDEYSGDALVFLDANENPFDSPYNRYPDPLQRKLKERIVVLKQVSPEAIFLGNGSDEPIDLLIRAFCEPAIHNVLRMDPTYGMYEVAAGVNNVGVIRVPLTGDYQLKASRLLAAVTPETRMIFLCSPNNPTGNALDPGEIVKVIRGFPGPVVLDEAYIDFAPGRSFLPRLAEFPNLVILQTFSKAWGMAGIRLGMAFADPEIIAVLTKIKYPYNVNILTQQAALAQLANPQEKEEWVAALLKERKKLATALSQLPQVEKVWPSDANFLLVKVKNARKVYEFLVRQGIVVRDRSGVTLCGESLRISVGKAEENELVIEKLQQYSM
ncbi:MAG: histidinol-phosphate transaminase [Prolixibacteraceae bacterium]|nr:histidinol-phosphate transaminase [Prolixibacteraceae bacterium]MDI9563319.1 histidinol-phosphate transaminase [Bacteroidota bacterium]NLS98653.1 histidinol-phosphate transaminase [Bacteroidales bacterium]HNZ68443.1 histidinol-phosphate transaminase [Prolixibacteraceae bacterium]HOG95563.1 histidinol-phosphate transaminase [Prolixibacteraceae bacterium]